MTRRIPEFWHTFGGTVFGILALGVMTLFNNLHANLSEIRRDLADLQATRAAWATWDDVENAAYDGNARLSAVEDALASPSMRVISPSTIFPQRPK